MGIENVAFNPKEVQRLFKPEGLSKNGSVVIIGGSELFHGAPILSLTTASRIVDMVFFSSPDQSVGDVANLLKSKLGSFVWVPWPEIENYLGDDKVGARLIGPGLMRYRNGTVPVEDEAWMLTRTITETLLTKFKDKKWVIDAGSLQVLEKSWIPKGAILTPNAKEYKALFGDMDPKEASKAFDCTIILKGVVDRVCSNGECIEVYGGNAGMAKGGTGDTLAGLTVALFAKNEALLSASCASYVTKMAGDQLFTKVRANFNADDLAQKVPEVLSRLQLKSD